MCLAAIKLEAYWFCTFLILKDSLPSCCQNITFRVHQFCTTLYAFMNKFKIHYFLYYKVIYLTLRIIVFTVQMQSRFMFNIQYKVIILVNNTACKKAN